MPLPLMMLFVCLFGRFCMFELLLERHSTNTQSQCCLSITAGAHTVFWLFDCFLPPILNVFFPPPVRRFTLYLFVLFLLFIFQFIFVCCFRDRKSKQNKDEEEEEKQLNDNSFSLN